MRTRIRPRVVAAVLAASGMATIAPPAQSEITSIVGGEPDPAQTGPSLTPAEEPVLTLAEQSAAGQVVAGDARLRRVLAGVPYTIADQGIWTTQAGRRLGAFLDLRLQRAASLHSSWPTMHYDERGSSAQPYSESETNLHADRVTEVYVLVDLKSRRVVSVQPGPDARVTLGPSVQVTTPQPGAED